MARRKLIRPYTRVRAVYIAGVRRVYTCPLSRQHAARNTDHHGTSIRPIPAVINNKSILLVAYFLFRSRSLPFLGTSLLSNRFRGVVHFFIFSFIIISILFRSCSQNIVSNNLGFGVSLSGRGIYDASNGG